MSACREVDRLIAAGREPEFDAHVEGCAYCAEVHREMGRLAETAAALGAPPLSSSVRSALYEIPTWTVSCEGAAELLAASADDGIADADRSRLSSHLSRCGACSEAAAVLEISRELAPPEPPPWFATKLAASTFPRRAGDSARPGKARGSVRRWILGPRGAIAVAYAAALLFMVLGLNPADLARKAGTARLEQTARSGIQVARNTVLDRFGAFQERAFRTFEVVKGRVGGYGRAALSTALALVMRNDTSRRPSRPRNEDGSGAWKCNEVEIWTWRAGSSPGGRA